MSVTIHIPTPLRRFTGDQGEVQVEGGTVGEALRDLTQRHPSLQRHLYTDDGALRSFVNVFLNDEDVRHLQKDGTAIKSGDTLSIIPSIAGGTVGSIGLLEKERDVEDLPGLSPAEIRHYSRHLILPEIGTLGQRKLKAAKVLMIGTGGLGSPLGLYLAAAGVGTLGLVDFDVVDESNLHRQVLFGRSAVGRSKTQAATDRLRDVNPHIQVIPYDTRLDSSNALELFKDYDVIVDGTDNFPTRYLVNDACVLLGKPNVYGSIFRFEGQVSVFWGAHGPCYRCLFPEPPPPGLVPSCAEGGVLGVLPGIIGSLQANEVIKLIAGAGDPLIGRLVLFDALKLKFRELKLRKNPDCPICSDHPTQHGLIDYEQFCGVDPHADAVEAAFEISTPELKGWLDEGRRVTLLDVRNPQEWEINRLDGATLIPLPELQDRLGELDPADTIVTYCHHGPRSGRAVNFLRQMGFSRAINLAGGIDSWSLLVDPSVPRY
ncbi:MAG TPA: molybdopterin-synthase adenylyltransferase MoeB [Thermoanaerobaculia bacterium]|nr:molybdopterin-synthase adenylyltransferase MoeB [Thermoanaerobaculia bacterium]